MSTEGFNPRGPCGPRRRRGGSVPHQARVSIHAARVGRDISGASDVNVHISFQSTRPVWAATRHPPRLFFVLQVSIHAARVGRDLHAPWS